MTHIPLPSANESRRVVLVTRLRGGRALIAVKVGADVLAKDQCDPSSAISRSQCLTRLLQEVPTLWEDKPEIERKLINLESHSVEDSTSPVSGRGLGFETVEPWAEPVDGAALLGQIVATLRRFVVLPVEASLATALWCLHTWLFETFTHTPRLVLASPTMRCGKSTLLRVIMCFVRRSQVIDNATPAVLFRLIESHHPTLLLDECDRWMKDRESAAAITGVINSGHLRGGTIPRCEGDAHEIRLYSTFAPMALAGIGALADTVRDRGIEIPMRRRAPGERVERLRAELLLQETADLRRQAARWAEDHRDQLALAEPPMPPSLNDRAADNWTSLLAIADVAGGEWPQRARTAAVTLSQATDGDDNLGVLLLADLQSLFNDRQVGRLTSSDIVEALIQMEERPWGAVDRGKPASTSWLARQLRPFGVQPRSIRVGATTPKGYLKADFADAFQRYLCNTPP